MFRGLNFDERLPNSMNGSRTDKVVRHGRYELRRVGRSLWEGRPEKGRYVAKVEYEYKNYQ
jgi:hypothetical protein